MMKPTGVLASEAPADETPQHEGAESRQTEAQEGLEEGGPAASAAFDAAVDAVQQKLYDEGIAEGIGSAILQASDPVKGVVEQAQMLFTMADEATGGSVPDEMYLAFGMQILSEVVEIAQAAGVQLKGKDMAVVTREFIASTIEDIGGDVTQVRQAMEQINPEEVGAQIEQGGE